MIRIVVLRQTYIIKKGQRYYELLRHQNHYIVFLYYLVNIKKLL